MGQESTVKFSAPGAVEDSTGLFVLEHFRPFLEQQDSLRLAAFSRELSSDEISSDKYSPFRVDPAMFSSAMDIRIDIWN